MECSKHHALSRVGAQQFLDTRLHFTRGFVGKRHSQDAIRPDAFVRNQICNALSQRPRLSEAGPASTNTGPFPAVTAFLCCGLSLSRKSIAVIIRALAGSLTPPESVYTKTIITIPMYNSDNAWL